MNEYTPNSENIRLLAHGPWSDFGCVSRVSPVQTALRNSTRDGGGPFGPFEFGDQELIPSCRKLLWSKALVVTQLLKEGVHSKIVSERLGHSKISIALDIYSHVMPGMQEDAAQKVDYALRKAIRDMHSE